MAYKNELETAYDDEGRSLGTPYYPTISYKVITEEGQAPITYAYSAIRYKVKDTWFFSIFTQTVVGAYEKDNYYMSRQSAFIKLVDKVERFRNLKNCYKGVGYPFLDNLQISEMERLRLIPETF